MKTLEQILRDKSPYGLVTIEDWQVEAMQDYADECAREALKNASENVKLIKVLNVINYNTIDKQSILSESNLPKHS